MKRFYIMELNICERRLFKLTLFCIHLHPTTRQWLSKLNFGKKELLNIVLGEILQIQRQKWFSASVQVILLLMTCSPKCEVPFIQNKLHTSSLQCDLQCKELEQKIWKCCKGCVRSAQHQRLFDCSPNCSLVYPGQALHLQLSMWQAM